MSAALFILLLGCVTRLKLSVETVWLRECDTHCPGNRYRRAMLTDYIHVKQCIMVMDFEMLLNMAAENVPK